MLTPNKQPKDAEVLKTQKGSSVPLSELGEFFFFKDQGLNVSNSELNSCLRVDYIVSLVFL